MRCVQYYAEKIELHAQLFLDTLKRLGRGNAAITHDPRTHKRLRTLKNKCLAGLDKAEQASDERLAPVVLAAYDLIQRGSLKRNLSAALPLRVAMSVLRSVRMLARVPSFRATLVQCVNTFPPFGDICIIPVPTLKQEDWLGVPIATAMIKAQQVLDTLGIDVPAWLRSRRPDKDVRSAYRRMTMIVHAEIQMALFLSARDQSDESIFHYLGISRKTCWQCGTFLQELRKQTRGLRTRSNHGKLYPAWTLPRQHGCAPSLAGAIDGAIRHTRRMVAEILCERPRYDLDGVKESTAVVTSTKEETSLGAYNRKTSRSRSKEQGCYDTDLLGFCRAVQALDPTERNSWSRGDCRDPLHECVFEESRGYSMPNLRCSHCKSAWYCFQPCQRDHWSTHVFVCGFRQHDSADVLMLDILHDRLPEDATVLEDYGFANFTHRLDRCYLLGLYIGLVKMIGVNSRSLSRWQREGTLVRNIKRHYNKRPPDARGGYYPWLLRNLSTFTSTTYDGVSAAAMERWYESYRTAMAAQFRFSSLQAIRNDDLQDLMRFYFAVLNGWPPALPSKPHVSFGFCTLSGLPDKLAMVEFYQEVLSTAPFERVLDAYEHNDMRSLLQPWKSFVASGFPAFATFLERPETRSLWELKQYSEWPSLGMSPAIGGNLYGLAQCDHNGLLRMKLREAYASYFGLFSRAVDHYDLFQAASSGRLLSYLGTAMTLDDDLKDALRCPSTRTDVVIY